MTGSPDVTPRMRRYVGFMVCGVLALIALPAGLMVAAFRFASGDLGPASALGAAALIVFGILCGLSSWRMRPSPQPEGPGSS